MKASNKVQYIFFGKVYPERANVSISELHGLVRSKDGKISGSYRYSISVSQVSAIFISDNKLENIYTLKNEVEDMIRVALDALGYTLACGYDLEIVQMINSLGSPPIIFGVGIPVVEHSATNANIRFDTIIGLYSDAKGKYLQLCLANLREAIRAPKDTGFFCYRGIESLRQFFLNEKMAKDDKSSWDLLREELKMNRSDIDKIKEFADPIRHGATFAINDEERATLFKLTWNIVNSFIKYAAAGYKSM